MRTLNIFIIGYMFAGKTTYGRQLAGELHIPFVDLDSLIEEECHASIPEIFSTKGEPFFRQTEHDVLTSLCDTLSTPTVISCGGGTPCHHDNLTLMKAHGKVIYLRTPLPTILSRALNERKKRPILANISDNELESFISRQLHEREFYYLQADIIGDSQSLNPDSQIINSLQK